MNWCLSSLTCKHLDGFASSGKMSDVPDYENSEAQNRVKIICLGDSAVGKSK